MPKDETISRRTALKILGVGVGAASAPSVFAQHPHPHTGVEMVEVDAGTKPAPFLYRRRDDVDQLDERLDHSG